MANGRQSKKGNSGRDSGGFVAMPWSALDSSAYARLGYPAKALLFELARQFVIDNNGRLLCSMNYLSKRGWTSSDVVTRAKRELIDAGFIFETVKGRRPNRASWYALTFHTLNKIPGYDVGALGGFERSAFTKNTLNKNASLTPAHGAKAISIAPVKGVETIPPTPANGAIKPPLCNSSTPANEHLLDIPSTGGENNQEKADDP